MRLRLPSFAVLATIGLLGSLSTTSHAEPLAPAAHECQTQLGKAGRKLAKVKLKTWQKCLDGLLTGRGCDAAARDAAITAAEAKFVATVEKKCTAALLFGPPPEGVGFVQNCNLEAGTLEPAEQACRELAVTDPASFARCRVCWTQAELHELLKILNPCLADQVPEGSDLDCGTPPASCPTAKTDIACTRTIARAGLGFFVAGQKALERCLRDVGRGTSAGPCPDASAQEKIADAERKAIGQIEKCDRQPPWWDVCPEDSEAPLCDQETESPVRIAVCVDSAVGAIVDEVVCFNSAQAPSAGLACNTPEPPPCAHDPCVEGGPLNPACDPYVAAACQTDSFCCTLRWDTSCIGWYVIARGDLFFCGSASCGDGVVGPGEDCDPPGSLCGPGGALTCSQLCRCGPVP